MSVPQNIWSNFTSYRYYIFFFCLVSKSIFYVILTRLFWPLHVSFTDMTLCFLKVCCKQYYPCGDNKINLYSKISSEAFNQWRGEHHLRPWLKRKECCKNMVASSCNLCKTRPKRGEYQQLTILCESQGFYIPQGASSVRYPSHNSNIFSQ